MKNDKTGVQRLRCIETAEVARVVGDKNKVAVTCVAHDIPVFPPGLADMRDMLGVMASLPGDGNQVDAETFVDQKPHDTAMVPSLRRA
jgi:hypothetical protein